MISISRGSSTVDVVEVVYSAPLISGIVDATIFTANRGYQVTSCREVHAVASAGAAKLQLSKESGSSAPGAGTDLLTNNTNAGWDLNATANTVQVGTLTGTIATLQLAAGDRLSISPAGTTTGCAGLAVTVSLQPLG